MGCNESWEQIEGGLKYVAVPPSNGELCCWGVNAEGNVYVREEGKLGSEEEEEGEGVEEGEGEEEEEEEEEEEGGLKYAAVLPGNGELCCWGVNAEGNVYVREEGK